MKSSFGIVSAALVLVVVLGIVFAGRAERRLFALTGDNDTEPGQESDGGRESGRRPF